MNEDIIYNKYIISNPLLNFHKKKIDILNKYKKFSYDHFKLKMRDNTNFRHNRMNTGINTHNIVNQINRNSGTIITTLNQLLNSLRNTNNMFQNNVDGNNNDMDIDQDDLMDDEFYENEEEFEFENEEIEHGEDEQHEEGYEYLEENSEESSNQN